MNDEIRPGAERRPKRREPKRNRTFLWISLSILVALAIVCTRPAYRWLKAKRAEHFSTEAAQLVEKGKWNEAAEKYHAALQLDPLGYPALQGAARLASQANRPEAVDLWEQATALPQTTNADRHDYAALLLKLGRWTQLKKSSRHF